MFRQTLAQGEKFLAEYPRKSAAWSVLSGLTTGTVGTLSKAFLNVKHQHKIFNQQVLVEAVRQSQLEKRGLLTIMNHVSTLDDPIVWGMMPLSHLFSPQKTRWTLGADNICFKNRATSWLFSLGQVLSTKRFGAGPFQPALDASVYLLSRSGSTSESTSRDPAWVHIFPEGFVHQPFEPFENTMKYFKWGLSRLILEPDVAPIVVPLYAHGMQDVFPEHRPKRMLGYSTQTALRYRVGESFSVQDVARFRDRWRALASKYDQTGYVPEQLQTGAEACELRSEVASYARDRVLEVRRDLGFEDESLPDLGDAKFWRENTETATVRIKGMTLEEKRQRQNAAR